MPLKLLLDWCPVFIVAAFFEGFVTEILIECQLGFEHINFIELIGICNWIFWRISFKIKRKIKEQQETINV